MTVTHVVVDGSNLATQGRNLPSLQQLDEAVRAYIAEFEPETVTVVVDASFPNRIDESERELFEEAIHAVQVISPPAGLISPRAPLLLQIAHLPPPVVFSHYPFPAFLPPHLPLFP